MAIKQLTVFVENKRGAVVPITETLARCDHIKCTCRKFNLLGRHCLKINFHPCCRRQFSGLFDLLRRDIGSGPTRSVSVHIPRQHARAGPDVKDVLAFDAKASVYDLLIELLRIDVSVPGVLL